MLPALPVEIESERWTAVHQGRGGESSCLAWEAVPLEVSPRGRTPVGPRSGSPVKLHQLHPNLAPRVSGQSQPGLLSSDRGGFASSHALLRWRSERQSSLSVAGGACFVMRSGDSNGTVS